MAFSELELKSLQEKIASSETALADSQHENVGLKRIKDTWSEEKLGLQHIVEKRDLEITRLNGKLFLSIYLFVSMAKCRYIAGLAKLLFTSLFLQLFQPAQNFIMYIYIYIIHTCNYFITEDLTPLFIVIR